jgi:hypothetical protein
MTTGERTRHDLIIIRSHTPSKECTWVKCKPTHYQVMVQALQHCKSLYLCPPQDLLHEKQLHMHTSQSR